MSKAVTSHDELNEAVASEIEAQVRRDAVGLDPVTIEAIVALVLRFGPSFYKVILRLFHVTPKEA